MASKFQYLKSLFLSLIFLQFALIKAHRDVNDGLTGDLQSNDLIRAKVGCMFVLLIGTLSAGMLPYFLRKRETFLFLGTLFAGGVFFTTAVMHYLNDSVGTIIDLAEGDLYIFGFILAPAGYLIAMFVDSLMKTVCKKKGVEVADLEQPKVAGSVMVKHRCVKMIVGETILLLVALCFHSVFEGIAVGISVYERYAWRVTWTVQISKTLAAIALGITLLQMKPKKPLVITAAYVFVFAIASPIGVGIGIAINANTQGESADWIYALSMGISSGILIYVAINNLIGNEFKTQTNCRFDTPLKRFLAVFAGALLTGVALIWQ